MGVFVNHQKSIILYGKGNEEDITYIKGLFGVEDKSMEGGMKYLGFHIKPNNYRIHFGCG